jgi:protein-disulfide isomerase
MNKKNLQIAAFAVFIAVAGGALYYGLSGSESNAASQNSDREAQAVHILKYSDYQCPACKAYVSAQEELKREFGDLVEIEYRHFPLSGHRFAALAAHSAEAARNQGKYKEMHDLIFEYQEVWSGGNARDHFVDFAEQIGLDMDQFLADIESEEVQQRVEGHRQEGIRRQVNATPTFFINGQRLRQNPQSYEQMRSIVELYMYRSS